MNKLLSAIFATLIFAFPAAALAGGGLISMDAYPNSGVQNYNVAIGEQFIVRPTVKNYDGSPCRNCPIKIKLENPQNNDLINQSSDKTDQEGTMYAKVTSYISGPRLVYAEATLPNGEVYAGSQYLLNYVSNNSVTSTTVIKAPENTNISVSSTQTTGASSKVVVNGQTVVDTATSSSQMEQMPQVQSDATLEAKVANLENQLAETNKRQSVLEQKLNSVLNWIKSWFGFTAR